MIQIFGYNIDISTVGIVAILAFFVFRFFKFRKVKSNMNEYVGQGAIILDVRNPEEFSSSCNPKSQNIPLSVLPVRLNELDKTKKIIVCCASGGRSAMAKNILQQNGFNDVINAGPWQNTVC